MTVAIKIECPKCHADRTMLDTCFGLPAYADPKHHKGTNINPSCVVPVRLVMCPRCQLLEMLPGNGNLLVGLPAFDQNASALRLQSWVQMGAAIWAHSGSPRRALRIERRLWRWHCWSLP